MKKLILITICLLSISSIFACSQFDSPSSVVKKYYTYQDAGKVDDAYKLLSEDARAMLGAFMGGKNALIKEKNDIKLKNGIKSIAIKNEVITGDTAEASFDLIYGNGTIDDLSHRLIT